MGRRVPRSYVGNRRRLTAMLGVVACALLTTALAAASPAQKRVIGSAHPILAGQPDQQAFLSGQRKVAKVIGWSVLALDAQLSVDKQISDIDSFITKKVSGITTFSLDPKAMEPAFKRARDAGIPVIGFNSEAPSVATNIKQDIFWTCRTGQDAAKFIAKAKPRAEMIVMGGAQVPVLNFVVSCFEKAAKAAGLKVLDRQDNVKDATGPAQTIAQDLLTKHPDVDAIWALNDTTSAGVYAALRTAGKKVKSKTEDGVVLVAGCCGSSLGANAIKAGRLSAVYDTGSLESGAMAVQLLNKAYKAGDPFKNLRKVAWVYAKRYDYNNIGTYVPYNRRDLSKYAK
jgi:ribose transport system substrate-binding protein